MDIRIREMLPNDTGLVYNAWLKSYRTQPQGRAMTNTVFYNGHTKLIDELLTTSTVLVAADEKDDSMIYGFICYEGSIIHYAYVKQKYRMLGIMNYLVSSLGGWDRFQETTHLPRNWGVISHKFNLQYNPYRR